MELTWKEGRKVWIEPIMETIECGVDSRWGRALLVVAADRNLFGCLNLSIMSRMKLLARLQVLLLSIVLKIFTGAYKEYDEMAPSWDAPLEDEKPVKEKEIVKRGKVSALIAVQV